MFNKFISNPSSRKHERLHQDVFWILLNKDSPNDAVLHVNMDGGTYTLAENGTSQSLTDSSSLKTVFKKKVWTGKTGLAAGTMVALLAGG